MNNTLNPRIQAVVALLLIAMFAGALFLPAVLPDFKLDADIRQTLLTLVVVAVGFYLGTSAGSARKDDRNADLTAQLVAKTPPATDTPVPQPPERHSP